MQRLINGWTKLTSTSVNRKIFGAAITVAILTAFVKIAAVIKELVVAWRFGTSDAVDAFLIALLVPAFIINVVAGSFNAALIPTYIQVREKQGIQAAQHLFSATMIWGLGLLGITTLLTILSAPVYLPLIAAGFDSEKLGLTFYLLCAIAPIILLSSIVTIWGAVLNAGERFALAALAPIATPAVTIIFLFIKSWGIFALAAGLVAGTAIEIILLGLALHKQGIFLLPKWYGINPAIRQVAHQCVPALIGAFIMCSATLVDQSMAAMLAPGSVASLNYGNRVIAFPITLATTALSTAVIPYFSRMVACNEWAGVRHTLNRYMWLIFAVSIPFTGLLLLSSELIVEILFQRGSFTSEDTQTVAQIQSLYALQIPFYIADIFVVKLLTSMRLNHILMWVSVFNLLINISLNYLFMQWIGVSGIALSTSCVYLFSFLYLLFFANKNLKIFAAQCD
ncbi:polysaccharide biosynthesis C-terminal domain-containing protein [Gloeocapsopsis crepidinum LEGE 06123]|uniref:Polysaccharide biosynthesis C-terminal domain-containing protein n=1 Tax=Gloeocapsopsis crepidinum LEGE 06123 TaxID=588587 RepID=A0ABR9USH2_9CHRO|nr:lipid II flippase MurJ [Gloeocapsopsis crepidinum]MBE9191238.1 polysaccharide biosynthesis C-terminal domain-containing protein [Gloeocapsopsis crepidinum LEGE 06123]